VRHIKLENGIPIDYSLEQLFADVPNAVIYQNTQMPDPTLLANYLVYPLVTTAQPTVKENETTEEGIPEYKDGEWFQTWVIRELTADEIQEIITNRTTEVELAAQSSVALDDAGVSFLADSEVQVTRYDICKSCPSFTVLKTCKECGCIMPLKIKVASAGCPLKKW
jgi:hypothetical protein